MPVFFQKITGDQFSFDSDFVVKESKTIHTVVGFFFLLFSFAFFSMSVLIGGFLLLVAIAAFVKSSKDTTVMKINKTGFFYYGKLVTDWDHFISDEFIDELPLPSATSDGINDEFYLLIRYYKDGRPGHFGRKIRLTNSQDKSEEEIVAAIKFYYKHYQEQSK